MHPNTDIFSQRKMPNQKSWVVKTHWKQGSGAWTEGEANVTYEKFSSEFFAETATKQRVREGKDGIKGTAIRSEVLNPVTGKNRFIGRKSINKGCRINRTAFNLRELAFAEHWADENERKTWINYGQGILQDLFIDRDPFWPFGPSSVKVISKRERMIVATVIQWLGSNCGFAFLREALNKCGYDIVPKQ